MNEYGYPFLYNGEWFFTFHHLRIFFSDKNFKLIYTINLRGGEKAQGEEKSSLRGRKRYVTVKTKI